MVLWHKVVLGALLVGFAAAAPTFSKSKLSVLIILSHKMVLTRLDRKALFLTQGKQKTLLPLWVLMQCGGVTVKT